MNSPMIASNPVTSTNTHPHNAPPSLRQAYPGQLVLDYWHDPANALAKAAQTYGEAVHFHLGPFPIYLFNHPDLIREILLTQQRSLIKGRGLQLAKKVLGEGLLTR